MSRLVFEFVVEMEDGETFSVVADQRDVAKWEVQPFGFPFGVNIEQNMSMTAMRFLAWSAAHRQQMTRLDWAKFNDACVEVLPPEDEEASSIPADAAHPGQPAASATPSSRSRTRKGNR